MLSCAGLIRLTTEGLRLSSTVPWVRMKMKQELLRTSAPKSCTPVVLSTGSGPLSRSGRVHAVLTMSRRPMSARSTRMRTSVPCSPVECGDSVSHQSIHVCIRSPRPPRGLCATHEARAGGMCPVAAACDLASHISAHRISSRLGCTSHRPLVRANALLRPHEAPHRRGNGAALPVKGDCHAQQLLARH